jgi:adenine-specific DNA-methyltransferase
VFPKKIYRILDFEFDLIFVKGDNNLENLKTGKEKWKVWIIEEEFKKRIFQKLGMSENVRFDSKARRIPEA